MCNRIQNLMVFNVKMQKERAGRLGLDSMCSCSCYYLLLLLPLVLVLLLLLLLVLVLVLLLLLLLLLPVLGAHPQQRRRQQ